MCAKPNSSFRAASKAVWENPPRQLAHKANQAQSQMNTPGNTERACALEEIAGHD